MAITNVPEEGKLIVLKGSASDVFEWPREGGRITRISGQRVYYTDKEGNEKFTHAFCAVCDTQDEVSGFLAFTERNLHRLTKFLLLCKTEVHVLWEPGAAHMLPAVVDEMVASVTAGMCMPPAPGKTKTTKRTEPPAAPAQPAVPARVRRVRPSA